ncbi:rubrerythrin family protein [Cetobacterium sp. 2A]|uniref:rubrerythrin n=1 Tax=Cetobacterium sp. 2A TaxID=2754723 RepID=UPI00163BC536|nr:rubrerythrin family protein [Cetobacterium sp. 2A]MBC2856679.1 rubrerythrin family protein [Cetobacterium sp. 2A]
MKSIKGTKTEKNLLAAFAGESQARNRYTMFSKVAKEEGYDQISALFLETAQNEYYHAKRFFSFLEGGEVEIIASYPAGVVGTTEENLREAAAGEREEWYILYPKSAEIALEEGFPKVAAAFNTILKVEMKHEERYLKLLENIQTNQVFKKDVESPWKCRACGYVHEGLEAPKVCPSCLEPQAEFELECKNY